VHPAVAGRIALRSSASSETVGVRTSTLRVDLFFGLLFFAVRLRLILDFFAFRFLAMLHPSRKSLPNSITLPNPHHFLYLRSIMVGFPLRLLVSLVETLALPSIIGLVSIIRLRSMALSN
jgi:hypothetical protein